MTRGAYERPLSYPGHLGIPSRRTPDATGYSDPFGYSRGVRDRQRDAMASDADACLIDMPILGVGMASGHVCGIESFVRCRTADIAVAPDTGWRAPSGTG